MLRLTRNVSVLIREPVSRSESAVAPQATTARKTLAHASQGIGARSSKWPTSSSVPTINATSVTSAGANDVAKSRQNVVGSPPDTSAGTPTKLRPDNAQTYTYFRSSVGTRSAMNQAATCARAEG